MTHDYYSQSVLAIYPTTRGYGYVLFGADQDVADWGMREFDQYPAHERNAPLLADIKLLLERYGPDVVAIEDHKEQGCRRSPRIKRLYRSIERAARSALYGVKQVSKNDILGAFRSSDDITKYEIADAVAEEIKAISHRLPRKRKIWESEPEIMGLFAAGALGLAIYADRRDQ